MVCMYICMWKCVFLCVRAYVGFLFFLVDPFGTIWETFGREIGIAADSALHCSSNGLLVGSIRLVNV